jgi:hypothetical protein
LPLGGAALVVDDEVAGTDEVLAARAPGRGRGEELVGAERRHHEAAQLSRGRVDAHHDAGVRIPRRLAPEEDQLRSWKPPRAVLAQLPDHRRGGVDLVAREHHLVALAGSHRPVGDANLLLDAHREELCREAGLELEHLGLLGGTRDADHLAGAGGPEPEDGVSGGVLRPRAASQREGRRARHDEASEDARSGHGSPAGSRA